MTHQTYTDEECTEWFKSKGPWELTKLMWRVDQAYDIMAELGGRMDHAEYEATKERGKIHEALAQYLFLCKEVHGIKRLNSTTEQQHLDKINFLEQMIKQQQQNIKHLEQMIKEIKGGMQCDAAADEQCDAAGAAADDVSMSDAPAPPDQYQDEAAGAHDQIKSKMKQLEHMIKPGPSVDVSMGSTGSSI